MKHVLLNIQNNYVSLVTFILTPLALMLLRASSQAFRILWSLTVSFKALSRTIRLKLTKFWITSINWSSWPVEVLRSENPRFERVLRTYSAAAAIQWAFLVPDILLPGCRTTIKRNDEFCCEQQKVYSFNSLWIRLTFYLQRQRALLSRRVHFWYQNHLPKLRKLFPSWLAASGQN